LFLRITPLENPHQRRFWPHGSWIAQDALNYVAPSSLLKVSHCKILSNGKIRVPIQPPKIGLEQPQNDRRRPESLPFFVLLRKLPTSNIPDAQISLSSPAAKVLPGRFSVLASNLFTIEHGPCSAFFPQTILLMKSMFVEQIKRVLLLAAVSSALALASGPVQAVDYTQSLNLDAGWNAVWLNVEPRYSSGTNAGLSRAVEEVFANAAITIVATPEQPIGSAEFITDAETLRFNQAGWRVWHRTTELKSDTLATVEGNQAYLVYVSGTGGITLNVTGQARFFLPTWEADSYNLVGFGLTSSVNFNTFFASSGGRHPVNKIFRLQSDGNWAAVRGTDPMESGEAYWIYSEGASSFYGPAKVSFLGGEEISFGEGPGNVEVPDPQGNPGDTLFVTVRELTISETSGNAQTVGIRKITPSTTGLGAFADELKVYEIAPDGNELDYDIGSNGQLVQATFNIAANSSKTVTLGAHRDWDNGARERENLYRIELGYNYLWLPMSAENADLSGGTTNSVNPSYSGLWIGEVTLDQVSSITEAGRPVKETTSKAPMRLLMHVDSTGNASLLSHVMFMLTKTATSTVLPEQVLVVNESKIPFFEGIEERGGKKVGKRVETVGYDMPRKFDTTNQSALVTATASALNIASNAVTDTNIQTYVNGQASRPPALVEKYNVSWPLTGGLAPDSVLTATLTMDPFHRSNPFRHAYHPKHGAGYALTRSIRIIIDPVYQAGVLTGRYEETISGLAAVPIVTKGTVMLSRVSEVTTLQ
jgi:hypothetical protein